MLRRQAGREGRKAAPQGLGHSGTHVHHGPLAPHRQQGQGGGRPEAEALQGGLDPKEAVGLLGHLDARHGLGNARAGAAGPHAALQEQQQGHH